jgi:phosphoribosylformylglycinamidine cyclo-ligase
MLPITYKQAGVDVEKTDNLLKDISSYVSDTKGFGGLYETKKHYLVGATDGVGTKIILARKFNILSGIGIDLVAMCVNDIICTGAKPLFFLDYYASSVIERKEYLTVLESIKIGCDKARMSLLGGETAELPGMFGNDNFDVAGFCLGRVKKKKLITGNNIEAGDVIIGLHSSGFHSNGYSLIRRWKNYYDHSAELIRPTLIYAKAIRKLKKYVPIKGIAHITGGGFNNIDRIIPVSLTKKLTAGDKFYTPAMRAIKDDMNLSDEEMNKTFNCGIGMVVVVRPEQATLTLNTLLANGYGADIIGEIYEKS